MGKKVSILGAMVILLGSISAFGDMTSTEHVTLRMMGLTTGEFQTIRMIKGDKYRSEDTTSADQYMMFALDRKEEKSFDIGRLDHGCIWTVFSDDSTYEEDPFNDPNDTIPPLVRGNFELEEQFNTKPDQIKWNQGSKTEINDTILGMPCIFYQSSAFVGSEDDKTDSFVAVCKLWVVSENDYIDEGVSFYRKLTELAHLDADYRFAIYGGVLSSFGLTLKDLDLDSVDGFPLKADISIRAGLIGDHKDRIDPDVMADEIVSEEFLESEAAAMESDAGLTSVETDQAFKDSMYKAHKELFDEIKGKVETGVMELLSYSSEIISIDTVTVLPDSLFEIPAGFTKR